VKRARPTDSPTSGSTTPPGSPTCFCQPCPLGSGRPPYYDYYAVILYLFDDQGNFSRIEDDDLFN
jgi:hypothetical protein